MRLGFLARHLDFNGNEESLTAAYDIGDALLLEQVAMYLEPLATEQLTWLPAYPPD